MRGRNSVDERVESLMIALIVVKQSNVPHSTYACCSYGSMKVGRVQSVSSCDIESNAGGSKRFGSSQATWLIWTLNSSTLISLYFDLLVLISLSTSLYNSPAQCCQDYPPYHGHRKPFRGHYRPTSLCGRLQDQTLPLGQARRRPLSQERLTRCPPKDRMRRLTSSRGI